MVFGITGQASAYFAPQSLIQVTYETTEGGYEVGYDIGPALDYTNPGYSATINEDVSLADFNTTTWADVNLAIFEGWTDRSVSPITNRGFLLCTDISGPDITAPSWSMFNSASKNVRDFYGTYAGDPQKVRFLKTAGNTYSYAMQSYGVGGYAGWNDTFWLGEVNLAPLDSGGTVTAYLFYGTSSPAGVPVSTVALLGTFTIGLDDAGNLYKTFTAVPIPPAAFLVGTGLIPFIRIRRKTSAA